MTGSEKVVAQYRSAGFADTDRRAVDEAYGAMLPLLPRDPAARILDLGCGGGEFLEFLGRAGFVAAQGVDLSPEQIARCRERGLARVEQITDARAWLRERPGSLACVVMNDVLEHIPKAEIVETLELVRAALAPGGAVVIKVPNAANVFGLVARYLDFTHEIAFTEHSLRQVLVAAGYRDVAVSGLPVKLQLQPRRIVYWSMNRAYQALHRAAYVAAVGADAPRVLTKLLVARAVP